MAKDGPVIEYDGYARRRYKLTLRDERSIVVFVAIKVRLHVEFFVEVAGERRSSCVNQYIVLVLLSLFF